MARTKINDYGYTERRNIKRKLKIAGTAALVVTVVVLEKRRVANLVEMSQSAVYDTMTRSFDEGVKYGLLLVKHISEGDGFAMADAEKYGYAFGAFDKK